MAFGSSQRMLPTFFLARTISPTKGRFRAHRIYVRTLRDLMDPATARALETEGREREAGCCTRAPNDIGKRAEASYLYSVSVDMEKGVASQCHCDHSALEGGRRLRLTQGLRIGGPRQQPSVWPSWQSHKGRGGKSGGTPAVITAKSSARRKRSVVVSVRQRMRSRGPLRSLLSFRVELPARSPLNPLPWLGFALRGASLQTGRITWSQLPTRSGVHRV